MINLEGSTELVIKLAIEARKPSEQEQIEIALLLDFAAPIPAACEPTVDAAPTIVSVAIESVLKKVR